MKFLDLLKEEEVREEQVCKDGVEEEEHALHETGAEHMLWFKIVKNMWKRNRNIYEEHIDHLKTYIQKPYKYSMIEYTRQMSTLLEYNK